MPQEDRRIYRFGELTLNVGEHCLKRGDQEISLPPKSFGVLLYLVERHGHLVKKTDLLDNVWADAIVTESALTWCINQVRNAIADDAQNPSYVQTIPRVGYKFIAPVEEVTTTEVEEEEEEEEYTALNVRITEEGEEEERENGRMGERENDQTLKHAHVQTLSPPRPFTHSPTLFLLMTILLATLGLGLAYFGRAPDEVRAVRSFIPLPGKSKLATAPVLGYSAISPDGTRIVFVGWTQDEQSQLWIRSLDAFSAQPLAGTEGANFPPFWSPDGRSIGFFAYRKLKTINASGGPAITLCDVLTHPRGGAWNQDGIIIFAPGPAGPLYRVSASGGVPTPITKLEDTPGVVSHRWPFFLPDGRHILYLGRCNTGTTSEKDAIYVTSLDSNESKPVLRASYRAAYAQGYLLFVRQGTLMAQPFDPQRLETVGDVALVAEQIHHYPMTGDAYFSVWESGFLTYQIGQESVTQLAWFDRDGQSLGVLGDPVNQGGPQISPDGNKVITDILDAKTRNRDLWIYEVARGIRTRFTFDPADDRRPVWSPNGRRVFFVSNRKGHWNLYHKASTGIGREEVLFESNSAKETASWSLDGRFFLYRPFYPKTGWDLWILPILGDQGSEMDHGQPVPFAQTEFEEEGGKFSPDGRWIAFDSDETGQREVYIAPFPGPGEKRQISIAGGQWPRWRGDGKEIFFLVPRQSPDMDLMAAEVSLQGTTVEVGTVRTLFDIQPIGNWGCPYDVTRDGQRFLVNTVVEPTDPPRIALVTNWTADLKRQK